MESTNATLLENFFELYTKDEFDFIISLLPYFELIKPIKQHTKEFRKDIKGFRPDRMPEKNCLIYIMIEYINVMIAL